MSNMQKVIIGLFAMTFFFIFFQNFLFSQSFSSLHLREVDDLAFQISLRTIHQKISHFRIDSLLKLNDYGYGWIFWIFTGLITYPFYLISLVCECYFPLIALPRQISLLFTAGTVFLVYKIISIYTKDEFTKLCALIFFLSFPAVGHFAGRFSTTPMVMFFSALTVFLAVRKNDYEKKDLRQIAISAAICIGTKLNGIMIIPLVGLILADRLHWQLNNQNLRKAGFFLLNLILFSILFINPSLFLSPFIPSYLTRYIESVQYNSHLAVQEDFISTLYGTLESGYFNHFLIIPVISLMLTGFWHSRKIGLDLLFATILVILLMAFLVKMNSMGPLYNVNYSMVFIYLITLCFVGFSFIKDSRKWLKNTVMVMFIVISITLNFGNFHHVTFSPARYFFLKSDPIILAQLKAEDEMRKIIADPKNNSEKRINVLMSHYAIFPYTNLDRGKNVNLKFSFDDLSNESKIDYDYVVLSKRSSYLLNEVEFSKFISNLTDQKMIDSQVKSRKIASDLINFGKIGSSSTYQNLLESGDIILLKKTS